MIHVTGMSRRDLFRVLSDSYPNIRTCEDHRNCVKRYPPKPGFVAHRDGFVDNWGVIHLSNLDQPIRNQGAYKLYVLIAESVNPEYGRMPKHLRLWNSHRWAYREFLKDTGHRPRVAWSWADRVAAAKFAEKVGDLDNEGCYSWATRGRRVARKKGKDYLSPRRVPPATIALWASERASGMTFGEIGRRHKKDYRLIWKTLVRHGVHEVGMR